jgi:hypothetical protein
MAGQGGLHPAGGQFAEHGPASDVAVSAGNIHTDGTECGSQQTSFDRAAAVPVAAADQI